MGYLSTRHERQGYKFIEITYGKDFIHESVLKKKYAGEFEEFDDPRAAVETAILIKGLWEHDEPGTEIEFMFGSPIDERVACNGAADAEKLRNWALDRVRGFPVCEWCSYREHPGIVFCSTVCGVEWLDDKNAADAEIAANLERQHDEEVTRRDIEFTEEHRQNL